MSTFPKLRCLHLTLLVVAVLTGTSIGQIYGLCSRTRCSALKCGISKFTTDNYQLATTSSCCVAARQQKDQIDRLCCIVSGACYCSPKSTCVRTKNPTTTKTTTTTTTTTAPAGDYFTCPRGSSTCNVFACGRIYLPRYTYQAEEKSSCCRAQRDQQNLLDRSCCLDNGVCLCSPNSKCARSSEKKSTTAPTTTRSTTAQPSTSAPTTTTSTTAQPSTAAPTTTRSTTAQPKTPAPAAPVLSYCQLVSGLRILNGRPVQNECAYKGIFNITVYRNGDVNTPTQCHAVYTNVTLGGKKEAVFVTTEPCLNLITVARSLNLDVGIKIGNLPVPISPDIFEFINGTGARAYLKMKPLFASYLDIIGDCQDGVCSYDRKRMPELQFFKDCRVVSYGAVDPYTGEQRGLNEVKVILNFTANACTGMAAGNLCARATSGLRAICDNDNAAPLYCTAQLNNERIFVGNVIGERCDDVDPSFQVVPVTELS